VIAETLTFLLSEVNRYLTSRLGPATADRVVLGNIARLADNEGNNNNNAGGSGLAMLTLVNIEEDKVSRTPENFRRDDGRIVYRNPKINLNLYVLFSGYATVYSTALEIVSYIIQCFQYQRTFKPSIYPALDSRIEQLSLDLFTLNFEQINHLWSTIGGKYFPSVLYKVRLITIEDQTNYANGEPIREIVLSESQLRH
jgi:Pvc16 N-terminal domain